MDLKNGEFTPDAFSGMGGYWCVFCQMSHTSHGCSHPGRAFARQHEWELEKAHKRIEELEAINGLLLEACNRAAQGYRNLVDIQILPHEEWDKDAIEEIERIETAIAAAENR